MRSKQMGYSETPGPGHYYKKPGVDAKFAYTKEERSKPLKGGDPGPGRNFLFISEYEIPYTVPSAPHYLIDPSIYYPSRQ